MPFRPNVHDELIINGERYRIAEHPAAPGIPYGQEGRAGIVYCLDLTPTPRPGGHPPSPLPVGEGKGGQGGGVRSALKVFKPRFRLPFLVSQADRMAPLAVLPGLRACRRTVLTPSRHADLLRQYPDLTYAVLMPWIEGPTWFDVLMSKNPLSPETSLELARSLAGVLMRMEEQGIAHCDLSAPNVMLPLLAGGTGVELVDLEGLYAPGMTRPQELSSGSAGYAHRQARGGLWGPEADRFAGAVLLAEMLGWCDPQVVQAAWGESYFAPQEMQQDTPRYRTLVAALERRWGSNVARLFERAWRSDSLLDCPTFGEWMVALPLTPSPQPPSPLPQAVEGKGVAAQPPGEEVRAAVEPTAEIRAFMQVARRFEEQNNYQAALEAYRQALELAQADPSLRSLAREIELTVQDVQARARPISPRIEESLAERAISLPVEEVKVALPAEEEPGIREEPYRKRPWGWVLGGLVVFALLAALVYGVNVQQQQDVVPPRPPTLPSPPPFWIEEFPTLIHAQYGQSVEIPFTIRVSPHSETMTLRPAIQISKSSPGYSYTLIKEHVTPKEALISPGTSFSFTTKIDTAELIKKAGEGIYTIDFFYWVEVRKGNTIYNVTAPLVDVNGKEVQAQLEVRACLKSCHRSAFGLHFEHDGFH